MKIENLRAGDIANDLVQKRTRLVDQSCAHFFDQLFAVDRLCQLFFRRRQDAFKTNDNHVFDDMDARFFRTTSHVLDFKLDDRVADLRLNRAFGFHCQHNKCEVSRPTDSD